MARIVNGGRVTIHNVQRATNTESTSDQTSTLTRAVNLDQAYLITMSGDGTKINSGTASGNRTPMTLTNATTVTRYRGAPAGSPGVTAEHTFEVVEYFT
jgi:hypothetical protein|tara:strand:+ start:2027 stop:2323 length:297 start_codon:yes stop_codon:yes gene_type:complete